MNSTKNNTKTKDPKKDDATYWHPAFCSAMRLEFRENKGDLEHHEEKSLSQKPLFMDLLVLACSPGAVIRNPLGAIFKKHNIFEYKSPNDQLNIDDFSKGIAYACLYKALAPKVNAIPFEELTLSFVRSRVPKKLLKQLKDYGFIVENPIPGIYYIHTETFQETHIQIIATSRLQDSDHLWLTSLTSDLTPERAVRLAEAISQLDEKDDREWADSVLHVAISENRHLFEKIMEVPDMCEALRQLFQPEIDLLEAQMADKDAQLAEMNVQHQAQLANLDAQLADKDEIIRQLQAQLAAAGINQ